MTYFMMVVAAVVAGLVLAWWLFGLLTPLLYVLGVVA